VVVDPLSVQALPISQMSTLPACMPETTASHLLIRREGADMEKEC
jgi:hypothetical protein